jgi:hypothetical protein
MRNMTLLGKRGSTLLAAGVMALLVVTGGTAAVAAAGVSGSSSPPAASAKAGGFARSIMRAERSSLATAVKAGWLSRQQAAAIESSLDPLLQRGAVKTLPAQGVGGLGSSVGALASGFSAAEKYLGLSPLQIAGELFAGKSLAQIAMAQGKTGSGVVQSVVGAARPQLASAVKAGRITSKEEATIEANLQQTLTQLVNEKLPAGVIGSVASGLLPGLSG